MESWQQKVTERKKAPTFASMYGQRRSNSMTSFCRITGKSKSMDEHHYVFNSDEFPKFENLSGCRITEKHGFFKDYKYVYPILDLDGVTRMVTEHDFHCRITAKYKAMAGHKYVYPVLGARSDKTIDDMVSVVDDETMEDIIVPAEVELIIRGGIKDILKLKDGEHIFIQSKEGFLFPAATKEIFKRKAAPVAKRPRRHTLPINLEATVVNELTSICVPEVKFIKDIKEPPPPPPPPPMPMEVEITKDDFCVMNENIEVLTDVRKSRPKRPGRSKNREKDPSQTKKLKKDEGKEEKGKNPKVNESENGKPSEIKKSEKEKPKRLSRLDKYKSQFQSFEEQNNRRETGSRLIYVGGFNEDEVEELDFSEPAEIQYVESQIPMENRAVITNDVTSSSKSVIGEKITCSESQTHIISESNGITKDSVENNECISKTDIEKTVEEIDEQNPSTKSFKELKSLIGSKLDLGKALKMQKASTSGDLNNNVINDRLSDDTAREISKDLTTQFCEERNKDKILEIESIKSFEDNAKVSTIAKMSKDLSEREIEILDMKEKSMESYESKTEISSRNEKYKEASEILSNALINNKSKELNEDKMNYVHENLEEKTKHNFSSVSNKNIKTVNTEVSVLNSNDLHRGNDPSSSKREKIFSSWKSIENLHEIDSFEINNSSVEQTITNSYIDPKLPKNNKEVNEAVSCDHKSLHSATATTIIGQQLDESTISFIDDNTLKMASANTEFMPDNGSKEMNFITSTKTNAQILESSKTLNNNEDVNLNLINGNLIPEECGKSLQKGNMVNSVKGYEDAFQSNETVSIMQCQSICVTDKDMNICKEKGESNESKTSNSNVKTDGILLSNHEKSIQNKEIISARQYQSVNEIDRNMNSSKDEIKSSETIAENVENALKSIENTTFGSKILSGESFPKYSSGAKIKAGTVYATEDLSVKMPSDTYNNMLESEKILVNGIKTQKSESVNNICQDNDVNILKSVESAICHTKTLNELTCASHSIVQEGIQTVTMPNDHNLIFSPATYQPEGLIAKQNITDCETTVDTLSSITKEKLSENDVNRKFHVQKGSILNDSMLLEEVIHMGDQKKIDFKANVAPIDHIEKLHSSEYAKTAAETRTSCKSAGEMTGKEINSLYSNSTTKQAEFQNTNFTKSKLAIDNRAKISDINFVTPENIRNGVHAASDKKQECEYGVAKPLKSHFLLTAIENDLDDSVDLHEFELRLPVTCNLLKKERNFFAERELSAIRCSPPSGNRANISLVDSEAKRNANWNNTCLQGIDVYVAIMDFKPMESDEEAVAMKEGQQVEVIDASKPRRWLVRVLPMTGDETPKEGWVPACYLEKSTAYDTLGSYVVTEADLDPRELEAMQNREAIVKELVETEEDFAKDMQFVVENYYKQMDNPRLPKEFRDRKGSVFGNFKDISDFHNNVLMEGIRYHAKEPTKLGKTFLRLERDFDMHANYCWNEARAQQLLREGPLKEYFDDHSRMIDDDKLLADHLKLPIQRLNDYQLLLKELIKYSSRLKEDTTDLQKALDFIHSINKRNRDLQILQTIEGCHGDLLKAGKIIRQEIFDVIEDEQVSERHVFLFKGRLFVTEKTIKGSKESYHVTNLFKLQDVEIIEDVEQDPLSIVFRSPRKSRPGFPLTLRARSLEQKSNWCRDIASANQVVEDLGDLEPSLERPIELKHKAEELEEPDSKKPKVESLKRQDSAKKDSVPQTPTEEETRPPLSRQESVKKKSKSGDSTPQTPSESDKPPKLSRQESVKKKTKSGDTSTPQTPVEETPPPTLKRQESVKKKLKSAESSAPQTPTEESHPPLTRQDSGKKSKKPAEETVQEEPTPAPTVTRQDSVGKKDKKSEEKLKRQDSKDKKDKTAEKKKGEDLIPKIIMSEDASGSDARLESDFNNEDNATLASESLRSDDSITPPASGAYANPSLPLPSIYRHLLILIPVLCAFYVVTEFLGFELWG